jgi:hypothetical protein
LVQEIDATIVTVTIHAENVQNSFQLIVDASGTATSGIDYSAGFPISFTVPTGTNDLSFSIVILGDANTEGDETIVLDMTANANVYFTIPTQTITITENVSVTSIDRAGIQVYPNPASSHINFQTASSIRSIECTDMSGRIVQSRHYTEFSKQVNWSLETLSAGSYFFTIDIEQGKSRVRVQIVK